MHLLIPFANSQSPDCQAALQGLKLPNLDKLLRKLPLAHTDAADESTLSPPHERALAACLGHRAERADAGGHRTRRDAARRVAQ